MKRYLLPTILLFIIPILSFSQITNVFDAEDYVIVILSKIGYFFWILSLAAFFWGLVKFINNTNDSAEREKGKTIMIWGLICFFVLISLWGIVGILLGDLTGFSPTNVNYVDKNGTVL